MSHPGRSDQYLQPSQDPRQDLIDRSAGERRSQLRHGGRGRGTAVPAASETLPAPTTTGRHHADHHPAVRPQRRCPVRRDRPAMPARGEQSRIPAYVIAKMRGYFTAVGTVSRDGNKVYALSTVSNRTWWNGRPPARRQECPGTVVQPLSELNGLGAAGVIQGQRDNQVTGSPSIPPDRASQRAGQSQQGGEAAAMLLDDDRTGRLQVLEPAGLVVPGTPSLPVRAIVLERLRLWLTRHKLVVRPGVGVGMRKRTAPSALTSRRYIRYASGKETPSSLSASMISVSVRGDSVMGPA